MQWRISIWIFIFIFGLLIDLSSGRGVLTIWLLNYKNVKGRTYDGSCCDNAPTGSDTCPDQCDYVMRCIVTGLGRANDHVFLFHRPIKYDSNDISFEDESSQMTQLTILFDEWPTTSSVKMDVFFYDYDDFDHTTVLVDWFETPLQRSVEKGEKQVEVVRGNRQMDKTRLEFKWSVHCFGTNDCLKPPPEWNIWPWAAESKTKSNVDSYTQSVSSYHLHNVSKSITTVNPTQTQNKTTVKIFNKNLDEQWVEADAIDGNVIRSPFTPFDPHTQHVDILNGREKLLDAREHARIIDAEERFDVAPARQANPIDDYHKPLNAHKKAHKGLNDNLIEPMPAIDDHFATDVPVVRDELLKEIYEKVAVELLSHDVKKDAEFSPADPSLRLQTIIAETEKKTGALTMPRNPYIDRNGEHIKLPNLDHSDKEEADNNSEDLSINTSYPQTHLMSTAKPYTVFERISSTPQIDVESITRLTNDDEPINTDTELPQKIPVVRKHRTKPQTVRKWDNHYDWKEHYKDYVLPKQHVSKVRTHVWSPGKPKRPMTKKKGEPVSRTGAKKYPQSSLNRLKEARKNSSIEIGYYRQRHTDFINQKRRKEKAKIKSSKIRPITPRPKIKMSDTPDFTTEKAKKIPINVAPINPYVRKRKPYQAILKLNSGFTDWSKDLRTKIPPVNPSAKVPMAAPSVVKNNIIPGHFKNDIITSKNSNVAVADQFNGISKVKTTRVDVDNVEKLINSKSISVGVPDYAKPVQNDIINGNNYIFKPKTHYVSDHIKPKTTSVIPDHVKTDSIKPKATNVAVPDHVKTDNIKLKTTSVAVPDHVKTDSIKPKTTSVAVPDHVKTDIINPKTTSVAVPDHVKTDNIRSKTTKTDTIRLKTTSVAVPDLDKTDNIKSKTTSVAVPDHVKKDIINPKTTSVAVPDHVKTDIIKLKTTSVAVPDHVKTDNIKSKTTSVAVPDHVKKDIINPKTTSVAVPDHVKTDIIKLKTTSVAVPDHVKTDNIKSKTTSVAVPDHVKKDIINPKTTSVAVPDHIKTDIIKPKSIRLAVPDHVKTDIINTKTTSVDVPDHVKTDIIKPKTTSVAVPDHIKTDIIKPKTTSVAVPDNVKKDISNPKTTSVDVHDHVKTDNIKSKTSSVDVPDRVKNLARNPIYGDVIKSKPTDAVKPDLVKTGSVSTLDPIIAKTTNGLPHNKKVNYSDIIRPLQPPFKSRDKTQKIDKKLSDAPNSVSSDSHRNKVSKVFHENNRSSFSVGPFLPDIDTDEISKTKGTRSTTIHSWYVFDNRLLPESKQSSKRLYNDVNLETPKKTTYHRETIDTKLKKQSEHVMQAKPTKVVVDPTKYIQTSSIKEALEKLNPKKSPFYPKRKPVNSQSKPLQTSQVKTINKKIKKTGEVFISESTSVPQKSTPKASKPTTVDIIQQITIASFTKASGRDRLVDNLPLPPNIKENVDSGPQIQGTPTAMRPKNSRNPTFNAILTPVPTKTTKSVHLDSKTNGLYINPVGKLTNEVVVTTTKSTETPVPNRFTPKDRRGLFEKFKSLSEIIKQASRKNILKTNHTSIKATNVGSNVKKSPFSPNPVERKPIVTSSKSSTIQWVGHSPKQKKEGTSTQSRLQTTVKPMATFGHTPVGPTSPSQSPVIVFPMTDVRATTTVSQMNIFEFLPNAIKEIYFGKAKQPFLEIHDHMHTTASVLETVRSKPTAERPFASDPDTPVGEKLNNDHVNQQLYRPFAPDPETQGPIATTKRPLSSGLDILDSLSNPDNHLTYDKNQKPYNPSVQVAPTDDREGDILNYVYHDPKTELKGMNFLFNKKRFDPKNPRNTSKLPRPRKPTTRYRRPQIPALASHKYFAYTRVGPADVFTTTPATSKRRHRFKLPALPTHRYFAYTRKDVPTTTKQPKRSHFGSFIERGKVKLVSKQGTRKLPIGFENKIPKHTAKTRFPNSAASKTFNPYNHFKSNTPSPRFPTKIGDSKSDSSKNEQTVTKHPVATQNEKDIPRPHSGEQDLSRSSQTSQSKHSNELVNRGQSTTTTKTAITEKNEVREHTNSTQSVNKFAKTAPDPGLRIKHQQSSGATTKTAITEKNEVREHTNSTQSVNKFAKTASDPGLRIKHQQSSDATITKATEDIRRTKSSEQSTATPATIQRQSFQTEDSLNRKSYGTTDNLQINSNASRPRPTASGNTGETRLETNRKVTITSDIFRWIYDLSKSLPEINKPVSKSNKTVNMGAPNIKDNGTSSIATDIRESNIFNPFINMFFNLTNTSMPNLSLDRTKQIFATGGKSPSVEEATFSTGSPTQYASSSSRSSHQTKEIWYKDVTVLTNKENEDIKRKIVEQGISQKTTKSDILEKDRTNTLSTNKPKSTLKSTETTEATSTRHLGPKKALPTTLTPSKATSEKTFKKTTSESSNKSKGTPSLTSKPVAMTTTKVMVTHTDEQSTAPSSSNTTTTKVMVTHTDEQSTAPSSSNTTTTKVMVTHTDEQSTTPSSSNTTTTEELKTPKKIELTIPPWLNITTPLRPNKTEMKIISTQPKTTTEKLSKITTMQPKKPTTKKPKQTTAKNPKKITTEKHQKPKTTKKPKKSTTKKPKTKTTKKVKTTKKPKKPTTKKPKTKTTKKVKLTTTKSPKKTTASTTAKTTSLPRTRKPVNITINVDPNSNDGPRIIVPNGGLFIPQPRDYNSSSYRYPGGLARLQVRKMNFKTVFNRYWPAILGLTVGTVFLVAAVLTSVACRQQRLYIRRSGWTDMPHHVSEPPDTSEYSSAASLVSDATRSSISFQ